MPRHPAANEMSIAQLEKLLHKRLSKKAALDRKRTTLLRKLDGLDAQISALGGSAAGRSRTRAHNKISLAECIVTLLKKQGEAMKVADIVKSVLATGYATTSDNFRSIVNQALIKDKRFTKGETRGSYQLRK